MEKLFDDVLKCDTPDIALEKLNEHLKKATTEQGPVMHQCVQLEQLENYPNCKIIHVVKETDVNTSMSGEYINGSYHERPVYSRFERHKAIIALDNNSVIDSFLAQLKRLAEMNNNQGKSIQELTRALNETHNKEHSLREQLNNALVMKKDAETSRNELHDKYTTAVNDLAAISSAIGEIRFAEILNGRKK